MTDLRPRQRLRRRSTGIPLDALVLNAGIMAAPLGRTAQGHEMHFGVNHLAHFLVQDALMPRLREAEARTGAPGRSRRAAPRQHAPRRARRGRPGLAQARIHEKWVVYAASKAENLLLTDERRGGRAVRWRNALHPGIATTNLVRYILPQLTAENRDPEAERASPAGGWWRGWGSGTRTRREDVWLASSEDARRVMGSFSWTRG